MRWPSARASAAAQGCAQHLAAGPDLVEPQVGGQPARPRAGPGPSPAPRPPRRPSGANLMEAAASPSPGSARKPRGSSTSKRPERARSARTTSVASAAARASPSARKAGTASGSGRKSGASTTTRGRSARGGEAAAAEGEAGGGEAGEAHGASWRSGQILKSTSQAACAGRRRGRRRGRGQAGRRARPAPAPRRRPGCRCGLVNSKREHAAVGLDEEDDGPRQEEPLLLARWWRGAGSCWRSARTTAARYWSPSPASLESPSGSPSGLPGSRSSCCHARRARWQSRGAAGRPGCSAGRGAGARPGRAAGLGGRRPAGAGRRRGGGGAAAAGRGRRGRRRARAAAAASLRGRQLLGARLARAGPAGPRWALPERRWRAAAAGRPAPARRPPRGPPPRRPPPARAGRGAASALAAGPLTAAPSSAARRACSPARVGDHAHAGDAGPLHRGHDVDHHAVGQGLVGHEEELLLLLHAGVGPQHLLEPVGRDAGRVVAGAQPERAVDLDGEDQLLLRRRRWPWRGPPAG